MATEESRSAQAQALDAFEESWERALADGRADRSAVTQRARAAAEEAMRLVDLALESDEVVDDARRITIMAEGTRDRERIKAARAREREARRDSKEKHHAATRAARQSYDAIRFSSPNKLGILRYIEIVYAFNIALTIVLLMLTSRDVVSYAFMNLLDWLQVILDAIGFWLLVNRFKVAKPYVIGVSIFGILAPTIFDIVVGQFSFTITIVRSLYKIFLIIYFLRSRRVTYVLVNDFAMHRQRFDDNIEEGKVTFGWPLIREMLIYFVVFSVLGHWMEMAMCQLIILGLVEGSYDPTNTMLWRDWLFPFPMEGTAVVLIALVLYPLFRMLYKKFSDRPILAYVGSFCANALTCSVIEFFSGLVWNAEHQHWDYSDHFMNIMGQVCLQNTVAFGVAASLIAWFVYPSMHKFLKRIPDDYLNIIFVLVLAFGSIIFSLYMVEIPGYSTTG